MRLVFMGTPDFVIPVLDALLAAPDVQVVGVYTPPDRPQGRGRALETPPVKAFAVERGLPVFQPNTLRPVAVQAELVALQPEVIVVAAYGKLLPPAVLRIPPYGCLNLHPSLLPAYRGPSPVATAILEGDSVTGVTLMLLDEGMDTGPIVAQRQRPINSDDTAATLTAALFQEGASLLLENLRPWVEGNLAAQPQDASRATITRKLERADGQADWSLTASQLERRCRAFDPWPGLFTTWQGQTLKLLQVAALPPEASPGLSPGQVARLNLPDTPLGAGTGDSVLGFKQVQLEGRRAASAAEFLRGYPQVVGAQLGSS